MKLSQRRILRISWCLLIATLLPFPPPASAQDSGDALKIEEIIVTAQKREQSLQDVPIAISAFTPEMLGKGGIENTWDLQGATPNLHVSGNVRAGQIFIRGIGSDRIGAAADSSSTVHLDGIYYSRPEALLGDFLDVERVEVLRGPQGTLYGRNSAGGTVNIVSKKPTEEFDANVAVQLGNFNKFRASGALGGALSDNVNGRLSLLTSRHDPYTKNVHPTGVDGFDDEDMYSVRAQLDFQLSDDVSLLVSGDFSRYDDNGRTNVLLFAQDPIAAFNPDLPTDQFTVDVFSAGHAPYEERQYWGLVAHLDWQIGDMVFKSITSYRETYQDTFFITGAQPFAFANFSPTVDQSQSSQEFQLSGSRDNVEWILGAYFFNEDSIYDTGVQFYWNDTPPLELFDLPTVDLNFFADHGVNAAAVFGEVTYNVNDQFRIIGGVRYSNEERSRKRPGENDSEDWDAVTPRLVFQYDVGEDTMLFASVSEGFKSGTYDSFNSEPAINPEFVTSYEVGMKSSLANDRLRLNISGFIYDYEDLQVVSFDQSLGIFTNSNAASSDVTGIEVELTYLPNDRFLIEFAGGWLDAVYNEFLSPNNPLETGIPGTAPVDLTGNTLRGAPEVSYRVAAEFFIPAQNGDWSFRAEYQYRDDVFFSQYNNPISGQEAYGLLNARIAYTTSDEHWEFSLFGQNLADEDYISSTVGLVNQGGIYGAVGDPSTYGIQFSYRH